MKKLSEYIIKKGYTLSSWNKLSDNDKKQIKDKFKNQKVWKVVHGNKKGQIGEPINSYLNSDGSTKYTNYDKALSIHNAIVLNKEEINKMNKFELKEEIKKLIRTTMRESIETNPVYERFGNVLDMSESELKELGTSIFWTDDAAEYDCEHESAFDKKDMNEYLFSQGLTNKKGEFLTTFKNPKLKKISRIIIDEMG